jgi:hypothetical protein
MKADLILHHSYVPEKSMQKETEGMRAEMKMKINEMIAAINKLNVNTNKDNCKELARGKLTS